MAKGKFQKWLEPEGLSLIKGWAMDGLTDEQIAKNMGIGRATLYKWENLFQDIRDAIKKGKEVADREVENATFKAAVGYDYTETKEVLDKDGNVVELTISKHEPPNITAAIFWLKNRKPDVWRDRKEHDLEVSGTENRPIILAEVMPKDE